MELHRKLTDNNPTYEKERSNRKEKNSHLITTIKNDFFFFFFFFFPPDIHITNDYNYVSNTNYPTQELNPSEQLPRLSSQ